MKTNFSAVTNKRSKIIDFVKNEVKEGKYPTRVEIEEKFHINLKPPYFSGIKDVYRIAKIHYVREPNPFIKLLKEKKLTKICLKLFKKLSYKIHSVSIFESKSGPDIILIDPKNNHIPVEIKAYHKYGRIGREKSIYSYYFGNEIIQLKRYIKDLNAPFGILVTSTNRSSVKNKPKNIKLIFAKDLKDMLIKFNLSKEIKELNWIRNSYVSFSKEKTIEAVQDELLGYVRKRLKKGKYVSKRELIKIFKINPYTYFKNMKDIYERLKINPYSLTHARMGGHIKKEIIRKEILSYVKIEATKGNYPTYKEIQKKFGCLPKLFFPNGIREIYRIVGVPYNRKFANKTKKEKEMIKREIIKFIKNEAKRGHYPNWREIKNKFKIGISNYFKNGIVEIYQMANIELSKRQ